MSLRRARFLVIYALFLLVLVELTCRLAWRISGVSFLKAPNRIHHFFYPELKPVEESPSTRDDGTYDVLVLGGSVLEFGNFAEQLTASLEKKYRRPVRVHSLARAAHTSLDSFYKYRRLHGRRFDLVVFYHGINEARANNVPPDVFDSAYEHCGWYRKVNALDRDRWLPWLALPAAARHGSRVVLETVTGGPPVSAYLPPSAWRKYGNDVRSAETFRANLDEIATIARDRRESLLLVTFATHVPEDYSDPKFRERQLDYNRHLSPIGIWGAPENVVKAVDAHNEVVRRMAVEFPEVLLIDQAKLMPHGRIYFNDVCHLTVAGSEVFVANLMETLLGAVTEEGTEP